MAVEISASIDETSAAAMSAALESYRNSIGGAYSKAVKVAAIGVCDSLRSRTKKAPARRPPKEYRIFRAISSPHYITYKNGKKLSKPLHRWALTTKVGTPKEVTRQYFVYCHYKRNKKGLVITDVAAEKAEIKRFHLGIRNHGLAVASWGKARAEIAQGGADTVWNKRRNRRNPFSDVHGRYTSTNDGAAAIIQNRLEYIESSLKPMAVDEAVKAAAAKLAWKSANAQGMTPQEAAEYAKSLMSKYVA